MTARKGIAGRTKVAKAFEHYHRAQGHDRAPKIMQSRYKACGESGISDEDNALYEVGVSIGLLINTSSGVFWMLLRVYSYPDLLNDIRK